MAFVVSTRTLFGAVSAAAVLALYAGCGGQSSERRGGGDIPDLNAGSGMVAAPDAGAGGAADAGAGGAAGAGDRGPELVPWCDAYKIINCVCQQCHQNPPLNGAPLPLVTYDDTQGQYKGSAVKLKVWQEMQKVITSGFMPYMGSDVTPPVKPLAVEQRATLLTWLSQGAVDVGGQDCPMTCDWSQGPPAAGF